MGETKLYNPIVPSYEAPIDFKKVGEQALPFAAGAGNQLLFGLPEAALKMISPEQKAKIDNWKSQNSGYGYGETAGTIGGMLIPGGAILKGAGGLAKVAGAAKLGEGLAGLGARAAGKAGLTQGLLAAGEQAIPRAVAGQMEGEDIGENALKTAGSIGIGGGLGLGLKTAGSILKAVKPHFDVPDLGGELREGTSEAIVGNVLGVNKRSISPLLKGLSPMSKIEKTDKIVDDLADILETGSEKIRTVKKAEEIFGEGGKLFEPFRKAYNDSPIEKFTSPDMADEVFKHPDISEVLKEYKNANGEGVLINLMDTLDNVSIGKPDQWFAQRGYLSKQIANGMNAEPQSVAAIQGEFAKGLKGIIDDRAGGLANPKDMADAMTPILSKADREKIISSGYDPAITLAIAKSRYPAILTAQNALVIKKLKDLAESSKEGSKTAMSQAFTSSDPTKSALNALVGEGLNKTASGINRFMGTESASLARSMLTPENIEKINKVSKMALDPMAHLSPKMQEYLKKIGGAGTVAGERVGMLPQAISHVGLAGNEANNQASLTGETPIPQMPLQPDPYTGAVAGSPQEIDQQKIQALADDKSPSSGIDQGLEMAWMMEDPHGIIEKTRPGSKEHFQKLVKKGVTNPDGSVNYRKASGVIFAGQPEKAKEFSDAYDAFDKIQKGLPGAVDINPLANDTTKMQRSLVKNTVVDLLKKGGVEDKVAGESVDKILGGLTNPAEKSKMILDLIRSYDRRFAPGGVLEQAGIALRG